MCSCRAIEPLMYGTAAHPCLLEVGRAALTSSNRPVCCMRNREQPLDGVGQPKAKPRRTLGHLAH